MNIFIFILEFFSVYLIKIIINHFQGESFYDQPLALLGVAFLLFKFISIFASRQNRIIQVFLY